MIDPEVSPTTKFNDIESLTTYNDNLMPQVDKKTLIKTKSLSTLFK